MSNDLTHPKVTDWRADDSESLQTHDSELSAPRTGRSIPAHVEQFPATVRASPCATNVASDYTDARYYLSRAIATSSGATALATQTDTLPGVAQCLTATNLAELAGGTHRLPAGTIVQVFAFYTRPGKKLYVFNQPPADGVVVQISGGASGGGKYTGQVLAGDSSAAAAGDLAMPEGMNTSSGPAALILNEEETGLTGHRIAAGSYAVGEVAGNSNGTAIVVIRGGQGATGSPTALGDGSGGSAAADSSSWSKASDGTPLNVWVQTRTVWDSGSGTLYGYLRKFSFDARGVLYAVSGESQITIDVATACS
jgi:hypothetical protein